MSYTPGPWIVNGYAIEQEKPRGELTSVVAHGVSARTQDWAANAHLIAAAPDLLSVCAFILDLEDGGAWAGPTEVIAELRAAVAKAIGEAPQ